MVSRNTQATLRTNSSPIYDMKTTVKKLIMSVVNSKSIEYLSLVIDQENLTCLEVL